MAGARQVQSAPITVHDVLFLQGRYGANRQLPVVPGLECSGIVVQSGGGLLAQALWVGGWVWRAGAWRWHLGRIRLRADVALCAAAQLYAI